MIESGSSSLTEHILAFCRELRRRGLPVTPGTAIDASRSVELVDSSSRAEFRAALRANLTTSVDQYRLFDSAFDAFWNTWDPELKSGGTRGAPKIPSDLIRDETVDVFHVALVQPGGEGEEDVRLPGGEGSASDTHILTHKDFADLDPAEARRALRLARLIAPSLATSSSRRTRPSSSGRYVDLARTIRASRRTGGEIVRLERQDRKRRRLDLVALLDVSGSMDRYSTLLIEFLHGLQAQAGHVRTFVFSTRLHDVSPLLARKSADDALDAIGKRVDTWSGGTSIGACLAEFNARYGARLIGPRTVVIIASDGWERGDADELARQVRRLRRRAHSIVWLNPLKGRDGYQPLARGMAAVLPFVDQFHAANSVAALEELRFTLGRRRG